LIFILNTSEFLMQKALFLILTLIFASNASSQPFSFDDWIPMLQAKAPQSVADALPMLPPDLRRNAALMRDSLSIQSATPENPRAILSNSDGSFVLTFNGDHNPMGGDEIEITQYHRDTHRFEFAVVEFHENQAPDIQRNLLRCSGCHGSSEDPHPVWDPYSFWSGTYGENGEKLEREPFLNFLSIAKTDPRYRSLVDLEATHLATDASGAMAGHPNSALLRKLMRLNFDRIANHAVTSPDFQKVKYATLATLYCVNRPNFAADFFPGLMVPAGLVGLEENGSANQNISIAFYWSFERRGVDTFSWALPLGDAHNRRAAILPPPDSEYGTATQELARALAARDPDLAALVGTDGRKTPSCDQLFILAGPRDHARR